MSIFNSIQVKSDNHTFMGQEFRLFQITAMQRIQYGEFYDKYNKESEKREKELLKGCDNMSEQEKQAILSEAVADAALVALFREVNFDAGVFLVSACLRPGIPTEVTDEQITESVRKLPDSVYHDLVDRCEILCGIKKETGEPKGD